MNHDHLRTIRWLDHLKNKNGNEKVIAVWIGFIVGVVTAGIAMILATEIWGVP